MHSTFVLITSSSLPFSELSLILVTYKIVSEITYNVSSGTLNPTILYHTYYYYYYY